MTKQQRLILYTSNEDILDVNEILINNLSDEFTTTMKQQKKWYCFLGKYRKYKHLQRINERMKQLQLDYRIILRKQRQLIENWNNQPTT